MLRTGLLFLLISSGYLFANNTWIEATGSAGWTPRFSHSTVVFDNKIWVINGYDSDDVWYSTDGTNWVRAVDSVAWPMRTSFATLNFKGKVWILGGYMGC